MPPSFSETLRANLGNLRDLPCRIVPTSFDPDDPQLSAYPLPLDWRLQSTLQALRRFKSTGVMMRLPLFWQSEALLHAACEDADTSIFVNEPENMPVGGAAIQTGAIDTVVTTAQDADLFSQFLVEKRIPLAKNWLVVHDVHNEWRIPKSLAGENVVVAQETHLFPCVPVLIQCDECISQKKGFHISDEFVWEENGGNVSIISKRKVPVPLTKFPLPAALENTGMCTCGLPRFEQIC